MTSCYKYAHYFRLYKKHNFPPTAGGLAAHNHVLSIVCSVVRVSYANAIHYLFGDLSGFAKGVLSIVINKYNNNDNNNKINSN